MKKTEKYFYYHNFEWEKPSYVTFYNRIYEWYSFEDAIKIAQKKRWTKTRVVQNWRVCVKCNRFKFWNEFYKRKTWKLWFRSDCKECHNKYVQSNHMKEENRIRRNEKEKIRRQTKWKLYYELDLKYYSDPLIKKNRKIIWKKESKKDIRVNKFYYFFNKWYDKEFLLKLYWLKLSDTHLTYND